MGNHSNINNMFIPYELALRLKELGFNEKCFDVYSDVKSVGMFRNSPRDRTPKILWQQAFDWIRVNKNIQIHIFIFDNEWYFNGRNIKSDLGYFDESNNKYPTYEDARLACLEKLIEIVENKLQ